MIPIITKKAATQMIATVFSCSGLGRVIPIASMIPLVNETSIRMIMGLGTHRTGVSVSAGHWIMPLLQIG